MCNRSRLQIDLIFTDAPDDKDIVFLRIIIEDMNTMPLNAMYRPKWQRNDPLICLTQNLDSVMAAHNSQSTLIVGDVNQHMVMRAFTELTVAQGLFSHVDFPIH